MKILQVVPYFPPAYAFGGPVQVVYQVSKELVKRGHEVVVFTTDAKDSDSRLIVEPIENVDGIKVYYMRNISMMPVSKSKLFITPKINLISKEVIKNIDIVHLHEYRTYQNIVIHHYAKRYKIPYILQAHGSLPRIMAKQRVKWVYDILFGYMLLRDASIIVALNQMEAQQYRRMDVPEEKIAVIPNGIDLSEYNNVPLQGSFKKKFKTLEGKKMILYLGRVHRSKGIDLLIKAYAHLTKNIKFNDAILVIAGPDDGFLAEAKSLASSLGVSDSIKFTGFLSSQNKLGALADADVFVTPSFHGFPVTFLEACTLGTPIITTTLGDNLDWIENQVGYSTSPKTIDLANAIFTLLVDDDLREKFSKKCTDIVQSSFSIDTITKKIENLYKSILKL